MKMSLLSEAIAREENRNENMISEYEKELAALPRGKITPKNVKGRTYYYLYYRDGKKIVSRYVGKDEASMAELRDRLARRDQVEEILKRLREEKVKIKKLEMML